MSRIASGKNLSPSKQILRRAKNNLDLGIIGIGEYLIYIKFRPTGGNGAPCCGLSKGNGGERA